MSKSVVITGASSGIEQAGRGAVDCGFRRPDERAKFAIAGGLGLAALAAGGLAWWTARRQPAA